MDNDSQGSHCQRKKMQMIKKERLQCGAGLTPKISNWVHNYLVYIQIVQE
jgi:hypothetical protein